MTAWDAIGDLDDEGPGELALTGKWAALLPSIPEGRNYLWHTERGGGVPLFGYRTRYWNFLLKLSKRRPSWTIQAQPGPSTGPFHWRSRRLSLRELCRLQTIPDDIMIAGSLAEARRQVGNAVPCALAYALAQALGRHFLGFKRPSGPCPLVPQRRRLVPPAEAVAAVPAAFVRPE